MAAAKRFTAEQIVAKLREAEKLQVQGATIPGVCKKLGVSGQTFYRWRTKHGALKEDDRQACYPTNRPTPGRQRQFVKVHSWSAEIGPMARDRFCSTRTASKRSPARASQKRNHALRNLTTPLKIRWAFCDPKCGHTDAQANEEPPVVRNP